MEAVITAPEADLLRRATQGDAGALEAVARAWYGRMRRWALLEVGDRALAEDAVQEALVRLIRHIHRYDPDRPFGPWLRTVVRNCCAHRRRAAATPTNTPSSASTTCPWCPAWSTRSTPVPFRSAAWRCSRPSRRVSGR